MLDIEAALTIGCVELCTIFLIESFLLTGVLVKELTICPLTRFLMGEVLALLWRLASSEPTNIFSASVCLRDIVVMLGYLKLSAEHSPAETSTFREGSGLCCPPIVFSMYSCFILGCFKGGKLLFVRTF